MAEETVKMWMQMSCSRRLSWFLRRSGPDFMDSVFLDNGRIRPFSELPAAILLLLMLLLTLLEA